MLIKTLKQLECLLIRSNFETFILANRMRNLTTKCLSNFIRSPRYCLKICIDCIIYDLKGYYLFIYLTWKLKNVIKLNKSDNYLVLD